MDQQNIESKQSNKKSRDMQVAHWEQHLASIIEKTNKNIQHLSQNSSSRMVIGDSSHISRTYVNANDVTMSPYRTSYQNNMPPPIPTLPPPPPLSTAAKSTYANALPNGGPTPIGSIGGDTQHPSLIENTTIHHSTTEGVTRPIPKHVQDDLTKQIEQSIRKSIERSINERIHSSQLRIDSIQDKIEALSDDFARVQRERDTLSRSLSTHDRLSRRLRTEWENQKMTLNKMESMIHDEKQATKEELDALIQRQTNDLASRVTVTQLKRAVETLSSKTRSAVEKTTLSVQNECRSDISSLRLELKTLNDSCENLREEMKSHKEQYKFMVSKFDEQQIKNIIGHALQSHLDVLEAKVTSTVRSSIQIDVNAFEEMFETKYTQKLDEIFNIDAQSKENTHSFVKKIAFIMKSILDEKKESYMDMFASSFLLQLGRNETIKNHFNF